MEWMILPLKRYAEFSGRSRRMEYWMFGLLQAIVAVVFGAIFVAAIGSAFTARDSVNPGAIFASMGIAFLIFGLYALAILIPSIAVAVRRLHDSDRSGWWVMIYFGPYLLSFVVQIMGALVQSTGLLLVGGVLTLASLIGVIVFIVFMCLPGTVGPNRFGPDPLFPDRNFAETFR